MRQTSAESREIDLMMRQWKPAKQTPARSSGWVKGKLSEAAARLLERSGLLAAGIVLAAAGIGLAGSASAQLAKAPPIQLVQTRITLNVSARPAPAQSGLGSETVLTAHVTDAAGQVLNGESGAGSVSFEIGPASGSPAAGSSGLSALSSPEASLGSAIIDAHGDATLAVTGLRRADGGTATAVHAVYHPGGESAARIAGSLSAEAMVQADATGVPNFILTLNPSTLAVTQGQFATTAVTITPVNGFSEQVTLSCAGLPAQVTCTFSPVIESTANGAFTSTLQVETQTSNGAARVTGFGLRGQGQIAFAWLLPGVLALAGFASLRQRALHGSHKGMGLLVLLIALGVGGLAGCSTRYGYNHHPPSVAGGTPVGTYTLTINASGNDGSAVTQQVKYLVLQVQ